MEAMKEKRKLDISADTRVTENLEAKASHQTAKCDVNTKNTEENLFGNEDDLLISIDEYTDENTPNIDFSRQE